MTPAMAMRRVAAGLGILLAACVEGSGTAPAIPLLDDVGTDRWTTVSVGRNHTCALDADGTTFCWGANDAGQVAVVTADTVCGPKDTSYPCQRTPRAVSAPRLARISAGGSHTCGLTAGGELYCWGANNRGQLGDPGGNGPAPRQVASGITFADVSAGDDHTCAVRTDGILFCWGANERGQLGNNSKLGIAVPVRVSTNTLFASVSAGEGRTCARTRTSAVLCWGSIWEYRERGLEYSRDQLVPQLVPSAPALAAISVGTFATCGYGATGFAYCWEANPRGQLGDGTTEGSRTPRRVASTFEVKQVSAGLLQTCAVATDGTGWCWGDNTFGQLGVPLGAVLHRCGVQQLPCSTVPIRVSGRQLFGVIATGFGSHSCGVSTRGNLYCWGLGVSGQRGDGRRTEREVSPIRIRSANATD